MTPSNVEVIVKAISDKLRAALTDDKEVVVALELEAPLEQDDVILVMSVTKRSTFESGNNANVDLQNGQAQFVPDELPNEGDIGWSDVHSHVFPGTNKPS